MAFEGIDMRRPETAERNEPLINLAKRFRTEPVETTLGVHGGFHEARVAEHPQVFGHGGLRHAKPALDLSHGLPGGDEEAQDGAAIRLGNDFEGGRHFFNIPELAYA